MVSAPVDAHTLKLGKATYELDLQCSDFLLIATRQGLLAHLVSFCCLYALFFQLCFYRPSVSVRDGL